MEAIRHISRADLHRINALLSRAFSQGRVEDGYRFTEVPECRLEFLEMYLDDFPEGSYLLEIDGQIYAFGFAHLWGRVGWVGPVAVAPEVQGRGHGREIMDRCVTALRKAGACTIGLETMPRSYRNLGFYGKLGFIPGELTVCLATEVFPKALSPTEESRPEVQFFSLVPDGEREAFLDRATRIARSACADLDYRSLILRTAHYNFGDTVILSRGEHEALAIGHTEPYAVGEERHVLRIVACAIPPPADSRFVDSVLAALRDWARREFLGHLSLWVPTRQLSAFRYLLGAGFRVVHSDLRMTLEGYSLSLVPGAWLLDKWE
ncbi:MAG: GNAT family N-acetyltransferase [candidate division KSB1 bacterium]|nr:GNAT family N-acetyltransferase [candidate division KSB1 bacterium]